MVVQNIPTLSLGVCRRVGNGEVISIWDDAWVPNLPGHHPNSAMRSCAPTLQELIKAAFDRASARAILSIPILRLGEPRWIWTRETYGESSLKSAYRLAADGDWSGAFVGTVNWKVWPAKVLQRHSLLWWQLIWDVLPMRPVARRIIDIDPSCPLYGVET
ncbi:hypothetical protein L484_002120 [Morus notabilis]|uniref:Reverse transcriptase zinc-binding domain-containing protein n=1 Tax=Morus notabilis TaxID=981085 RepID=W9RX00_9ROSA|nr:hypothetical protein L484_002120 [Morus notabilis]